MTDQLVESAPSISPWRTRDFRLVWCGGFVNDIGDWLLMVALPVYVFIQSGSGSATAILFVVELVAALVLGPVGGSLVDRWDLRRTLIVTNLAQAVTLVPLLAVTGDRIWPAYLVVGAQAMLTQINNPPPQRFSRAWSHPISSPSPTRPTRRARAWPASSGHRSEDLRLASAESVQWS
jgi:MFS family permease